MYLHGFILIDQPGSEDAEDEWEQRCAQTSCSPEAALHCPRRKLELHHSQVTFSGVSSFLHFKSAWLVENSHPWSPRVQRGDVLTWWSILMMLPSCRAVPRHLCPYKGLVERCYSVTHPLIMLIIPLGFLPHHSSSNFFFSGLEQVKQYQAGSCIEHSWCFSQWLQDFTWTLRHFLWFNY